MYTFKHLPGSKDAGTPTAVPNGVFARPKALDDIAPSDPVTATRVAKSPNPASSAHTSRQMLFIGSYNLVVSSFALNLALSHS